jgi:hypothetical protein
VNPLRASDDGAEDGEVPVAVALAHCPLNQQDPAPTLVMVDAPLGVCHASIE